MNKNKKIIFSINFNSYYPHANVIQNNYFIHFLPKDKKENVTSSTIQLKGENKIKIKIDKISIIKKEPSTSVNYLDERNYIKEKNINNQLEIIYQSIESLKKQDLSKKEILEYIKSLLYSEEKTKQKIKTPQK